MSSHTRSRLPIALKKPWESPDWFDKNIGSREILYNARQRQLGLAEDYPPLLHSIKTEAEIQQVENPSAGTSSTTTRIIPTLDGGTTTMSTLDSSSPPQQAPKAVGRNKSSCSKN